MPGIVRQIYDAGRMAAASPALGEAVPISPILGRGRPQAVPQTSITASSAWGARSGIAARG